MQTKQECEKWRSHVAATDHNMGFGQSSVVIILVISVSSYAFKPIVLSAAGTEEDCLRRTMASSKDKYLCLGMFTLLKQSLCAFTTLVICSENTSRQSPLFFRVNPLIYTGLNIKANLGLCIHLCCH